MTTAEAMIVVINTKEYYVIVHFPGQHLARYVFSFRKDFLSEKKLPHIRLLPLFPDAGRSVFLLNGRQDMELNLILQKIADEKDSGYIFSDDLQRTYIVELVHFITKLHHHRFDLLLQSSAN